MKHNLKIISIILTIFILTQIIGLFVVKIHLSKETLPFNVEKPQFKESTSYIPILFTLLIVTILALFLIKFQAFRLWKVWFFIAALYTLTIAFSAFIAEKIAGLIALILTFFKVIRPNIIIHNLTELFIYGGLAAIFVPVLNVLSASILLIAISIYDMIAVWKTKHMIKMAKFQTKSKIFPGLLIPYELPKLKTKRTKTKKVKTALLGGGDLGFPLLFTGVIMKTYGFSPALIVVLFSAISLLLLFLFADKKKFYPAMPFLTLGCFVGFGISLLI